MKRLAIHSGEHGRPSILSKFAKQILTTCLIASFFLIGRLTGQGGAANVTVVGTGNTTGHIATLTVTNPGSVPLEINEQTAYIPSGGQYQPYIITIPKTSVPPNGTVDIPGGGYCADVHTPPVPSGHEMPPLGTWVPVGDGGQSIPTGTTNIIPGPTQPTFTTNDIPRLTGNPGYKPNPPGSTGDIITTWPGTEIPVGGVIDPKNYPDVFASVIVEILEQIEVATDVILTNDGDGTPFSNDPPKERESVVQQTLWIVMADITGNEYGKDDFTDRVYDQYQTSTGKPVGKLQKEQKNQVDEGIGDFWNTFQAVGVEAKVISAMSPGLDLELDEQPVPGAQLITDTEDCKCGEFTYDLEVKRSGVVVHSASHTTPTHPIVSIDNFKLGDILEIKISNIVIECKCEEVICPSFPAEDSKPNSTGSIKTDTSKPGKENIHMENDGDKTVGKYGNNNCKNSNGSWNADENEYSFRLETKDEKSTNTGCFQKVLIKAYCELEDCSRALCKETVQINFIATPD